MDYLSQSKYLIRATSKYNELNKYLTRPYSDRPIEVLPNIRSDDPRLLSVAREFSDANNSIEPVVKDGFIEAPYILGNFDAIRQIAGYQMDPLGSRPPVQKTEAKPDFEFERILKLVTRTLTASAIPVGVSLNKISSIGFPERVNDLDVKTHALRYFINNYEKISSVVDKTLEKKISISEWGEFFHFIPISIEGRRNQHTDKIMREGNQFVPRIREVFDWLGVKQNASRTIKGYNDFFRTRSRFVYGATGHLNYGAQFFASSLREQMGENFEFLFYTGPHNFADKLKDFKHMVSADVTSFDQNFDDYVSNIIIDNIQCYDDSVKNLMRLMVRMPVIKKNDHINGKGWTVSSDIDARQLEPVTSNPSGWAWVTEFAKICGVALMVATVNKLFKVDESNIDDLLKGKLQIAFLNTGDDMVFLFKSELIFANFKKLGEVVNIYKFKLEFEKVVNYLGMSLRLNSGFPEVMLDIRNIVVKTHVPERGIGSVHKPFFAFGLRNKLDIYSKHPAFEQVYYQWNSLLKKYFGYDLLQLAPLDKSPFNGISINVADSIFLDNPDAIHYKIKSKDVSKELLNAVFSFVELKHFDKLKKHLRSAN